MARKPKEARRDTLSVTVDKCRIRVQTCEPTIFIDARKAEDRAAGDAQVAGSIRLPDDRAAQPPCHKRNYIVVYCA